MHNSDDVMQTLTNYEIRRAAVQCWTNLCVSELQVKRCEGDNDKVIKKKILVLF